VAASAVSRCSTPKGASRSRCSTAIPLTRGIGQDLPQRGAVAVHARPDLGHRPVQRDPAFTGFLTRPARPVVPRHHPGQRTTHDSKQQSSRRAPRMVRPQSCRSGVGEQAQARFRRGTSSGRSDTKPLATRPLGQRHRRHLITKQHINTHSGSYRPLTPAYPLCSGRR
jgi:hypothetical protein